MFKKTPTKGPVPGSSKSKKSSTKDKERKKLLQQNHGETSNSNLNHEKYVSNQINTEGSLSYVGFHPETISVIAEQFLNEEVDQNVCEALAEDISYKMRELLSVARLKMRHSKRSYLKCADVDSAFRRLNLEPVYGAGLPNWITFGDPNNYTCTLSKTVDLVDISKSETTIVEPGDMGLEYKWFKDVIPNNLTEIDSTLKHYCDTIMKFSISNKDSVRHAVLRDVAKNHNIGPIIPALCNFCFLILQKNITYSSLAMPVLQLLEAIMFNPCTRFSAEEKQITLLIYLLLESIMNASNLSTEVVSTCRTLGRMCACWTIGGRIIVDKITKHLPPEPYKRLTAPVISALTYIGNDALNAVLWPQVGLVVAGLQGPSILPAERSDMISAVLDAARLFYKQENCDRKTHEILLDEFGEKLEPLWNLPEHSSQNTVQTEVSTNWVQLKKQLLMTHKIHCSQETINRTSKLHLMFKRAKPVVQPHIHILGYKSLPIRRKTPLMHEVHQQPERCASASVITGRRTLLTLKKQFSKDKVNRCNGMMYTI